MIQPETKAAGVEIVPSPSCRATTREAHDRGPRASRQILSLLSLLVTPVLIFLYIDCRYVAWTEGSAYGTSFGHERLVVFVRPRTLSQRLLTAYPRRLAINYKALAYYLASEDAYISLNTRVAREFVTTLAPRPWRNASPWWPPMTRNRWLWRFTSGLSSSRKSSKGAQSASTCRPRGVQK